MKSLVKIKATLAKAIAKPRDRIRQFFYKYELVGRAIAYNKAFFFVDLVIPMERNIYMHTGDNAHNPLYHDPDKSEYLSRIIYANKAVTVPGEVTNRIFPGDQTVECGKTVE